MIPRRVQRIINREAQIVGIEFGQRRAQRMATTQVFGKLVSGELKVSRNLRHYPAEDEEIRSEDVLNQRDKANQDWSGIPKTQSCIQRLEFEKRAENQKHEEHVYLKWK